MYLLGLFFCVPFVIVSGIYIPENTELKWPTKYTFEAEKISLINGWVEDIRYWRAKHKSRVDYNDGAVKILNLQRKFRFGLKYQVHPETSKEKENYLVCKRTNGTSSSRISVVNILPNENDFSYSGHENLEKKVLEKFSFFEEYDSSDTRKTIWAIYNKRKDIWIPIRYEDIEYDVWLGSKKKHDIWNFHTFETVFNSSVFDFENIYDCQDSDPEPDDNSRSDNISSKYKYHVDHVFSSFKENYNKTYANKDEHSIRRNLFQKRLRLVLENNSKNTGYKLAINKFADRTPEETKKYMGLIRPRQRESATHPFPYTTSKVKKLARNLPYEFDLRDLGLVTPVKDQEECGSCWTFGTTSAVEGALARKNGGRLIRLSNQALLDCAWGFGASGCDGGADTIAYRWMMEYGLPSEEEYGPYANREGICHIHNMSTIYPILGYTNVTPLSIKALKVALVNHGPLSVSIHATDILYLYKSGIFYDVDCDPNKTNHEVTLVGYGKRDGEEYWIVKNSWGQNWGIDGYFHISVRDNSCGITSEPTYPIL